MHMISPLFAFLESSSRIEMVIINYPLCVCVCTISAWEKSFEQEEKGQRHLPERDFPLIIRQAYPSPTCPSQPNHQSKCNNHHFPQ